MSMIIGAALALSLMPSRMLVQNGDITLDSNGVWSGTFDPEMPWDELVVSWNCDLQSDASLSVKVCPQGSTRWYSMGVWANSRQLRTSVKDQNDDLARVDTDTLILKQPAQKVSVRLEVVGPGTVDLVSMAFRLKGGEKQVSTGDRSVWGKTLEPPQRAQMSYLNGNVICSATATSMVLGYWAKILNRDQIIYSIRSCHSTL
ncbi:MAG: hypothetical protein ABL962_00630 [Fimbriimonadaceae bacterium]